MIAGQREGGGHTAVRGGSAARIRFGALLIGVILSAAGCVSGEVDTTYGYSGDLSINGTRALLELFKDRGHSTRATTRLSDNLLEWADVIVRFAPYGGPPAKDEADWYIRWLTAGENRRLIYVVNNYDAETEFWDHILDQLPATGADEHRKRVSDRRNAANSRNTLPPEPRKVGSPEDWFQVPKRTLQRRPAARLSGPWAEGVNVKEAAIPIERGLGVQSETVLLRADDLPVVITWERFRGGRVLVAANGSFLLNASLLNRARRPLTERVVDWIGRAPSKVAFVEGDASTSTPESRGTLFALLRVQPFGWIIAHLVLFGVIACLARAPRLGPPRDPEPTGVERPIAHPIALGALLARAGRRAEAESLLDAYRRWRSPTRPGG